MLLLLACRPHFEDHCIRILKKIALTKQPPGAFKNVFTDH